jgi:hypothetical protein
LAREILTVTIYNPAEWDRETFYIEFDNQNQRWHFWYRSKPNEPIEAERYYSKEDGIEKFYQYIDWLKW